MGFKVAPAATNSLLTSPHLVLPYDHPTDTVAYQLPNRIECNEMTQAAYLDGRHRQTDDPLCVVEECGILGSS